jgi:hypothetical protein
LIVPILLRIEKRKILFLAEFKNNGNLTFYDSDEIICGEEEISKILIYLFILLKMFYFIFLISFKKSKIILIF